MPTITLSFNLYTDDVINNWQIKLPEYFMIGHSAVNTLLLTDDQAVLSNLDSGLPMVVHPLRRICNDFGLQIFTLKTKVMAFHGADTIRTKIVVDGSLGLQF